MKTWHCACARIQKRRHFHAKTTIAKLYIYMKSCPHKIQIPHPPKKSNTLKKKLLLELHTAPALYAFGLGFDFFPQNFLDPDICFGINIFLTKNFFGPIFCYTFFMFQPKYNKQNLPDITRESRYSSRQLKAAQDSLTQPE